MSFDGGLRLELIGAASRNNVEEVYRLLQVHAKKIGLPDGTSPLLIGSCAPEGRFIVKYLIEKVGMDINAICPNTRLTALEVASMMGHTEIVKYLIQRPNIDPNKTISPGKTKTPLDKICSPFVLEDVYKQNINSLTALNSAYIARPNVEEIVKLLLAHEKTDPNPLSYDENNRLISTPCMMLIALKKFDAASLILNDKRFKVDNLLKCGETELHQVIRSTKYPNETLKFEHVKKLIAAGADPTIRQDERHMNHNDNANPIELARESGLTEIADYLENVRLEQSNNRYKDLRAHYLGKLDKDWQENPERIYDSLDGIVQYAAEAINNSPALRS